MEIEMFVRDRIKEIIGIKTAGELSISEDLREHGMSSLDAIELVVSLEMEFNIEFLEEDLMVENLCTIEKLIYVVEKYLEYKDVR